MKVRFTPDARDDLASIAGYLRPLNPTAAIRVRQDIQAAIRVISQHPYSGRTQDGPGVRKAVSPRYTYLVFYEVDEAAGVVTILAVRHPAQDREHADA